MLNRRNILLGTVSVLATPALVRAQTATINWITHPAILDATGGGELLRQYERLSGTRIEVTTFPTEALGPRISSEFVARSPAFDVVSVADAFWTSSLARFVEPLDEHIARNPPPGGMEDFSPGMVQQFRVPQTLSGPIMGIPQRVSVSLLYYRRDLLQKAGIEPPATLDAFYTAAKALTRSGMQGCVFQGAQGQAGVLDWYEMAAPNGVDLLQAPNWNKAVFNTPGAVAALDLRRRLIAEGIANQGVISYGFDDAINAMVQNKAAMSVLYSAYWPRFEDKAKSEVAGLMGYAPSMCAPGVDLAYPGRGWALSINGASTHKAAAWDFIRWLTDAPQQKWMALNKGNPVSRLSVARDAELAAQAPIAGALAAALPHAKIMPNTPALPRVYDAISAQLGPALSGAKPAAAALAAAEASVNTILG